MILISVDNEKDALGSAFLDILNSVEVRKHVSGPTHCRNHTLDLILSHGIDVNGVEVLQRARIYQITIYSCVNSI